MCVILRGIVGFLVVLDGCEKFVMMIFYGGGVVTLAVCDCI